MATVYLAHDLKHDRPIALKVLHPELAEAIGPERRFLLEIRTAARLEHPHILPVLDSGEAHGQLWYTMPYVEGESLRDRLRRELQLPVEDAVRLVRETADALEYAHAHGIVHRDIKPENILLSAGHVRVADFGIAKALEMAGGETLTVSGLLVGTPAYMSPEQAAGEHELDGRTDIYSLGCVLYELLAGEPLWSGPTPLAVLGRRFVESPSPLEAARPGLPAGLEQAVTRSLARSPAERFQSAGEFRDALAGVSVAAAPGSGSRPPSPQTTAPSRRRHRGLPVGLAALALGLPLGLGVLFAWLRSDTGGGGDAATDSKLLAVLPFKNLGDSTQAYFAEGVSNAVRGKLAALPGLRVIAGASSSDYRHTTKPPEQIARELGVRYLLVGTVLREGGAGEQVRVQVSPELVEVGPRGAPTTKWQEPIEAALADVFQVHADLARGVAEALGVRLGAGERLELAESPTRNLAAYNAYLRGEQISNGVETSDLATLRRALPYYEQAIALDSTFVQAWTQLARARAWMYGGGGARSPAEAEAARAAAERALALAPNRPEGRLALGDFYLAGTYENDKALEQYTLGLQVAPNNVDLLYSAGLAEQSLGRWDTALQHFRRAYTLNPRSVTAARTLAYALLFRGRRVEALAATDRALALEPNVVELVHTKVMMLLSQGDLAGAQGTIRSALKGTEPSTLVATFGLVWDLYWVLEEPEQQLLLRLRPSAFDDNRASWSLVLAQLYALQRDRARARVYADSARLALEEQLKATPEDAQLHGVYGLTLAYLGRKPEAVREGERGVALAPLTTQTLLGPYLQHQLVRIYLLVGEPEKALDRLEPLLRIPYYLSPGWLRIDPTFAPLRGNPRFERLLNAT